MRVDLLAELREHGRLIARARPDLEHALAALRARAPRSSPRRRRAARSSGRARSAAGDPRRRARAPTPAPARVAAPCAWPRARAGRARRAPRSARAPCAARASAVGSGALASSPEALTRHPRARIAAARNEPRTASRLDRQLAHRPGDRQTRLARGAGCEGRGERVELRVAGLRADRRLRAELGQVRANISAARAAGSVSSRSSHRRCRARVAASMRAPT